MRAIVIGGTGGMGQGVARDLIKQEKITNVTLGDINIDPDRLQEKLRASDKISLIKIDVNDHDGMVGAIRRLWRWPRRRLKQKSIILISAMTMKLFLSFFLLLTSIRPPKRPG